MSYSRPNHPSAGPQYDMYDDQAYTDEYRSSSQNYETARKDHGKTPPRGSADNRMHNASSSEQMRGERQDYSRDGRYERSRSPRREGRGRYLDRDREGHRSPRDRSRSRSRSPYFGAPPNRNVIIEGLPPDMTQEDDWPHGHFLGVQILHELQHTLHLEGVEEVRLIKDKRTGQSRQFAFAQFNSIPHARRFLERFFPAVPLYGGYDPTQQNMEPTRARIAYSREKDEKERAGKGEDDWNCEVCTLPNFSHRILCFRCNAPRTRSTASGIITQANVSSHSGFATTGDSDVSPDGTSSQFILLRGLEPGVSEELLAKGVGKLYKAKLTTPPAESSTAKKPKIASTSGDASLGAREGTLRRVLLVRDRSSGDSWRYGFAEFNTVEDAQAAMAKYKALDKFTISSKPVLVSYIHAGVFVPVLHAISEEVTKFTFNPLSSTAIKLMYWDEAAYVSQYVTAIPEKSSAVKNKKSEHARLAAAAANEGLLAPGKDGEPKAKKRKVEKDNKPVVAPHLQFWTNRHAEIHGITPKEGESKPIMKLPPTGKRLETSHTPSQSFADLERKCCLLCSRQFKTEAEVNKHERISQLHRDNLKNEELVAKASSKIKQTSVEKDLDGSEYRDRAKERRQAFNQPKQPSAQHNQTPKDHKPASPKVEQLAQPPVQSKGAALLGKMGWTEGEGLGAQGTGRTDTIATELYTQGVGLGAAGGKMGDAAEEAQRQTKSSYSDFLNRTKEKAKERFESLG